MTDKLIYVEDDGLPTDEVGPWCRSKYTILYYYNQIFATGMKGKWDSRIYIDLFAASGRSEIRGEDKIALGSPMIALGTKDPYDKYIFCEKSEEKLEALRTRVKRDYPDVGVSYILGDCNEKVDEIRSEIPENSLSFCFVDPYKVSELRFDTIKSLDNKHMDFLILLPLGMDAIRNVKTNYTRDDDPALDLFFGDRLWRDRWRNHQLSQDFPFVSDKRFLAEEYAIRMKNLGHMHTPLEKMMEVRTPDKNMGLYHLAYFSRHKLGYKFWDQVLKYSTNQTKFEF